MTKTNKKKYGENWYSETDNDGIVWLHIDKKDASTNVLASAVLKELDQAISDIKKSSPTGMVILSDKSSGFIAGADIHEFTELSNRDTATEMITFAHGLFSDIEALPFPTVAMIHGFCLGGGMELALSCRYRIADDDDKTRLGLPEVLLGIHPGIGGTVRLLKHVAVPQAMDMMLTGRSLRARAAKKIGLVDAITPGRHLKRAARDFILRKPAPERPGRLMSLLGLPYVRTILANYLRRKVALKAAPEHYPAPYALIDLWEKYGNQPQRMLHEEIGSFVDLITSETAQNLVRVFFLREQLKSFAKLPDDDEFNPTRVHVIGGGVMGGDIAIWCALHGFRVTIQDRKPESLAKVIKRANSLYKKKLKKPRLIQAAMDRLMPDMKGNGLSRADVIIEAIFEDVEVKRALFKEIEPKIKETAVMATNTSSIPLEKIGTALKQPERLVGIHFFNPVSRMPLVEIVTAPSTSEVFAGRASAFVGKIDHLPLPVKSAPGFLVNRVLMPYLMEAMILVMDGIEPEKIDMAAVSFGMPMGPIELADTVGLDICLHVAENLSKGLNVEVPAKLKQMVEAGDLGRKTGKGFYTYTKGKPEKNKFDRVDVPSELADRLIFRLLNESVACLRDGVVADADQLDGGVIFGTGFAPFRGGPMHYAKARGIDNIVARLEEFKSRYGDRYTPEKGWETLGE